MSLKKLTIVPLCELKTGQEADFFALLSAKEEQKTRDGKPYFRVTFRDAGREVTFPIWIDAPFAAECKEQWVVGRGYKLRALYRETTYGPQLEIKKIREVVDRDVEDGYDPSWLQPRTRFDPAQMFEELLSLAREHVGDGELCRLVVDVLESHRERMMTCPAAVRNHHTYSGGLLEHVLSVSRLAVVLAEKYDAYYPELVPRLDKGLVVAGAILHDIGKLRELAEEPTGAIYTPAGNLVGHVLQGRDIIREFAAGRKLDPEKLLRLEHIIVSHQRLPEWGSPKPPMTPEAMLVHYADDLDAKYNMVVTAIMDDATAGPVTSSRNVLGQKFYRGT